MSNVELGSFADLKNVKVGEVEPPKNMPAGHYAAIFSGPAKEHVSSVKKTLALRFPLKITRALDDVDAEELEAAGGIPDKDFTIDFWMSPDARYRFTEFGKAMGHSDDLNLIELAEALATSGEEFQVSITHEPRQDDPTKSRMRIDNAAPLSE
jgi:hypothetical protein